MAKNIKTMMKTRSSHMSGDQSKNEKKTNGENSNKEYH